MDLRIQYSHIQAPALSVVASKDFQSGSTYYGFKFRCGLLNLCDLEPQTEWTYTGISSLPPPEGNTLHSWSNVCTGGRETIITNIISVIRYKHIFL